MPAAALRAPSKTRAARAVLRRGTADATSAAIRRGRVGVHARPGTIRPGSAPADTPLTSRAPRAEVAASAAIRGTGRQIRARLVAERFPLRAGTRSVQAGRSARTAGAAGAAVGLVREQVHAPEPARKRACSARGGAVGHNAKLPRRAGPVAPAAIVHVGRQGNANSSAIHEAVVARTVPGRAHPRCSASVVASTAVSCARCYVDAGSFAERSVATSTGPVLANSAGCTNCPASAAVGSIGRRVGTRRAAGLRSRGAAHLAVSRLANLPRRTTSAARAAVRHVGLHVDAAAAAVSAPCGTDARSRDALFCPVAGGPTSAAVLWVDRDVDACARAGDEGRRASCLARAGMADLARSAAVVTPAAVIGVVRRSDALTRAGGEPDRACADAQHASRAGRT
jgi:hypothetical protein